VLFSPNLCPHFVDEPLNVLWTVPIMSKSLGFGLKLCQRSANFLDAVDAESLAEEFAYRSTLSGCHALDLLCKL